ncbi:chondroitinase-B domain-containing protein [Tenacibaculum salmonis]|uniref:chondroitinase-B domain-containing protein n=1 Tax=Tenacibaculum sp. P3-BQ1 TaxID=3232310 RepID=UPI0034DED097
MNCNIIATALLSTTALVGYAQQSVTSIRDLENRASTLRAGDELVLTDGTYQNINLILSTSGTATNPIIIRAENTGQVFIEGNIKVELNGNHIVFKGFVFQNGKTAKEGDHTIKITGDYNTVSDCSFLNLGDPSRTKTSFDIYIYHANYNKIYYNEFIGKQSVGNNITINPGSYNEISRNRFSRPILGANSGSAIRLSATYNLVEYNYFFESDGEGEIITVKDDYNLLRYNTFRRSKGGLSLRHGDHCVVYGNYFFGESVPKTKGISIWGEHHFIVNNYFEDLKPVKTTNKYTGGKLEGAAVSFNCGSGPNAIRPTVPFFPVAHDVTFAYNTIITNSEMILDFTEDYLGGSTQKQYTPYNLSIRNNIFFERSDKKQIPFRNLSEASNVPDVTGLVFKDNFSFGNKNLGINTPATGLDTTTSVAMQLDATLGIYTPIANPLLENNVNQPVNLPQIHTFAKQATTVRRDVLGKLKDTDHVGAVAFNPQSSRKIPEMTLLTTGPRSNTAVFPTNPIQANKVKHALYPNPASGSVYFRAKPNLVQAITAYKMQNQGTPVSFSYQNSAYELDISSLTIGTYILEIQFPNKTITKNLIVR